ncbi:unnamed protein product [Closterium sp. NIES-54]
MFITLYFIVTRLPDSLRSVRDHFLSLDPTVLTIDLLEQHFLAAETSVVAVGAARGTPCTPFFEGAEDAGAASTSAKCRSSKGKGGRGGGNGSGSGGGGTSGGGGGSGGGGSGGSGSFGGGGGGSGGSGGSGSGGNGDGRTGAQRGGSGGGQRQRQHRRSETPSPQQFREWLFQRGASGGSVSCPYVIRTGDRAGQTCGKPHTQHCCFSRLDDAWRTEFGDEVERPHWAEMLRSGVAIFDLDYDAILSAMYALSASAEGDCYRCVPPDPGIQAAALGASESSLPGTAPTEALHTFTLDSGASRWFFRDKTTPTPLPAPVPIRLADPSEGPVIARSSTVLPCLAVRPAHSCVDLHVYMDGSLPATFTHRPGLILYTLATEPPQVAASAQVSALGQVAHPCLCHLLSHHALLWHHRLGHPSLPRLHGMHSRLLVSGLPKSLPPLPPSPAPPYLPCVEGRQRAAPHFSSSPRTTAPLHTLHMDVWGPANVSGQGCERYFLLSVSSSAIGSARTFPSYVCTLTEVDSMIHAAVPHFLWPFAGAEPGGAEPAGVEPGGADPEGVEPGGVEPEGVEPGGAESEGAESGGAEPRGTASSGATAAGGTGDAGAGGAGVTAGAGGTGGTVAAGPGGARTRGTRAAGTGGVGGAGVGDPTKPGDAGAGGAGAGGSDAGGAGAGGVGAVGTGAGGTGAGGAGGGGTRAGGGGAGEVGAVGARAGGTGAGGAGVGGAGAVDPGAGGGGGTERSRPYFVLLLQQVLGLPSSTGLTPPILSPPPDQSQPQLQPASPLPAPSPYTEQTSGLTERCEPASRPASPVRTGRRVPRPRPPPVPGTHAMALRPSSVPLRVPLLPPPESSLPAVPDPESDRARAASPTVSPLIATVVTDHSFESTAASALIAELVDFAAACRLDYTTALVTESESASPPSIGGECALGTDVLEDRKEDFECLAAAAPRFASMLLAPEGDPDAPDIPTPRSYAEAITAPPSRANIVDGMWIFRVKRPPGSPLAFKARYVRDYELHSFDFSTAFLEGSLHEEIWLRRPPGFTGSFPAGTQWSLQRPVYGLRQAPHEWHDTLRTILAALGFAPSTADPSLFLRTDTSLLPFYVLVYVNDLVFATADTEALTLVKSELQKRHTCTDLGELRNYLGLQITRDRARRTITLTQSHMVHQVLQRFRFQFSSPQPTPLSTGHSLSAPPLDESVKPGGPYLELVGCLMYLMTCTRPDLAYLLSLLACYVAPLRHRKVQWDAAKRVLRYLCSISGMGLVLGGRGPVVLTGHADASWVDDSATQRSSQGYTFSLGAMAAQELCWLTYLLTDLGEQPRSPLVLYVDNMAMIALCQEHSQEHSQEHRTKHIARRYFLVRELQQRGQLRLAYVATRANTADVLTKALPPGDHQRFSTVLGLVPTLLHLLTS